MWVLPVSVGSAVCPEPSSVSSSSSSMNDTSVGGAWTGALKVESKTGKGCLNKTLKWKMHKGKNLKEPKVWTNSCKKMFDLQRGVKTEDLRCLRIDFIAFCWIYSQIRIQIKHFHRRFLQSDGRLKEFSTSLWSASDKLWLWSAADEAAWPQWPPSLLKRFEPAAQAAGKSSSHERSLTDLITGDHLFTWRESLGEHQSFCGEMLSVLGSVLCRDHTWSTKDLLILCQTWTTLLVRRWKHFLY